MMKIAFVMTSLNTGGIATSLINLLNEISKDSSYSIDLILFHSKPQDKVILPKNVRVLFPGKYAELIAISQAETKKKGWRDSILRYILGVICRVFGHGVAYRIIFKYSESYKDYDVAISCSQSAPLHSLYGGCNEFVLNNIKAKNKITFIHCDYVTYGINDKYSHKIYKDFDKIAVVSDSVSSVFLKEEPLYRSKTLTVKNCHDINKIFRLSQDNVVEYSKEELNIITVARFGSEKGHIRALAGLKRLKDKGVNFKWHLVGGDKEKVPLNLINKIQAYGLEDQIVFYGVQQNPYRFMVKADFLLVPSFHEAAPMVFDEARLLHLPILTTNTVSAVEMVEVSNIGLVCENTAESLNDAIYYIATHRDILKQYRKNTYKLAMDNSLALEQFRKIIGDKK